MKAGFFVTQLGQKQYVFVWALITCHITVAFGADVCDYTTSFVKPK